MNNKDPPVIKSTIHVGTKYIPISDGSKVHFHFQTWKLLPKKKRVLLDDSKRIGKKQPMVLIIGHKFKLEVWEDMVRMMSVNEVASFKVKQELTFNYPFVSKTIRELDRDVSTIRHSCSMTLQTEGIGYADLDDYMKNPCDLLFIVELLKVENADEYEKDIWQLSIEERFDVIPKLKEKGNQLYAEKKYEEAESMYCKAIGVCEQLMLKERQTDDEWAKLNMIKLPILLNYAQCRLNKEDYYGVIEYCNTVLEFDKDNEKALYRRAKAHLGAWNPDKAIEDYNHLKSLNPKMAPTVDKELALIKRLCMEKVEQDKGALRKMFRN